MAEAEESPAAPPIEPLVIVYCPVCTMPEEYCEYGPSVEDCYQRRGLPAPPSKAKGAKPPAEAAVTDGVAAVKLEGDGAAPAEGAPAEAKAGEEAEGEEKKEKKKKKKKEETPKVRITVESRGKHKYVTSVSGLAAFGVDVRKAVKGFATKFAASASMTDADEITVQGDITDSIEEYLAKTFKIDESSLKFDD